MGLAEQCPYGSLCLQLAGFLKRQWMNLLPTEQRAEVGKRVHVPFSLSQMYKALVHLKTTESTEMTPAWSGQIQRQPKCKVAREQTRSPLSSDCLMHKTPPTHAMPRRTAHTAFSSVGTGKLSQEAATALPTLGFLHGAPSSLKLPHSLTITMCSGSLCFCCP